MCECQTYSVWTSIKNCWFKGLLSLMCHDPPSSALTYRTTSPITLCTPSFNHWLLPAPVELSHRSDGGLEVLNFENTNNTFKINWLKRCLLGSNSLWYFIPNNIFKRVCGIFLNGITPLENYLVNRLYSINKLC